MPPPPHGYHRSLRDDADEPKLGTFRSLSRLIVYLRPYKFAVAVSFVTMLVGSFLRILLPLVYRWFINEGIHSSFLDISYFALVAFVLFCFHAIIACLGYLHRLAVAAHGQGMIRDLRNHIFTHLQSLSLKFYDRQQSGELMSRIMSDVDRLEWGVVEAVLEITNSILTFVFMIFVTARYINLKLTLVALCTSPVMLFMTWLFNRKVHDLFMTRREKIGDLTTVVQENLSGVRVVKAFGREDHELNRFQGETNSYFNYGITVNRLLGLVMNLMEVLASMASVVVLVFGGWLILNDKRMNVGELFAMMAYVGMLQAPIRTLIHANYHMQRSGASARRVFDLLDTKPEIVDAPDALELPMARGHVEFRDVTFSYNGSEPVLRGINLMAEPGQMVAFVGKSGAGKSTLVHLIPRLYEVANGCVLVDGIDVRKIRYGDLRRNIAMVMQDVFLFNGSIKQNIAYGKLDATDEEIFSAAHSAHADEFVQALEEGYDTQIGERGVRLSGGQRQRLSVARAILADAPILVLDEPTSNVDTHSERLIQDALEKLMRDRTTFVVAHRLSTIIRADKIVLLDAGEIKAVGRHNELMQTCELYAHLYRVQAQSDT